MNKSLKNVLKYPSPEANASTSPAGGEVLNSVCNASSFNVMLACEHSELPRASRNIMSLLKKRMYHPGSSANELTLKAKDDHKSVLQLGRSMIEMLGVLAIIGVLSVGGIAGYSKAMEKFKLNKWKDDFVTLTANLKISFINSKSYTETDNQNLTNFFKQVGIVPQNMLDAQNRDVFGNELRIWSYSIPSWGIGSRLFLHFWTQPNQNSVEECKELFIALSEYDDAWAVVLNEKVTGRSGGILTVCGKAAPKFYCQQMGGVDFNLANVAAKCAICAKQRCDIIFLLANGV